MFRLWDGVERDGDGMIYIVVAQAMRLAAIARDFIFV